MTLRILDKKICPFSKFSKFSLTLNQTTENFLASRIYAKKDSINFMQSDYTNC